MSTGNIDSVYENANGVWRQSAIPLEKIKLPIAQSWSKGNHPVDRLTAQRESDIARSFLTQLAAQLSVTCYAAAVSTIKEVIVKMHAESPTSDIQRALVSTGLRGPREMFTEEFTAETDRIWEAGKTLYDCKNASLYGIFGHWERCNEAGPSRNLFSSQSALPAAAPN